MPDSDPDSEFVALLTEHQAALRLYVNSLLPGDPSAADVSQLANSTIWKKRSDFELGTNFKAWIFSIARYEVLNYRKTQARDRLVFSEELLDIMADEMPRLSDDMVSRQQALKGCLESLKSPERDLILHRYFEDTSLAEYAEKINRSVGGLKVTLHRIRTKLQSCIEQKLIMGEAGQ
ncbi:MAG: sigma-70 family RNA polymerase sigma factor [Verrucomicrobiales bacterium]|nr:sigma-70 family RNA polymerase sigma factor [Verrucomicrobiales bacterium]